MMVGNQNHYHCHCVLNSRNRCEMLLPSKRPICLMAPSIARMGVRSSSVVALVTSPVIGDPTPAPTPAVTQANQ